MAPLALVLNLTTRELHLNWFQIWPPDGANCTGYKFYHQIAPLALLANLAPVTLFVNFATRWHFLHWFEIWQPGWLDESHALPHCLGLPFWHYQLVLTWYLHQSESHQLSFKNVSNVLTQLERTGPIDRTPGTPWSNKKVSLQKKRKEILPRMEKQIGRLEAEQG